MGKKEYSLKGYIMVFASTIFFYTMTLFVKAITKGGRIPSTEVTFFRFLIGFIIVNIGLMKTGYKIKMVEQVNDFQFCKTYSIIDTCGNFYFEDDFILLPQGWSMFGYTCLESLDVVEAFSDVADNIEIVKDEWGLAYLPAWGFSAFDDLEFGEGYQIKMIEEVSDFQFCETIIGTD